MIHTFLLQSKSSIKYTERLGQHKETRCEAAEALYSSLIQSMEVSYEDLLEDSSLGTSSVQQQEEEQCAWLVVSIAFLREAAALGWAASKLRVEVTGCGNE